jgi:predicted phage tail protein
LINFSDPDNHYQDRTTAVMFPDLVKQFKFKQTQITAIGCTRESEAQARRVGGVLQLTGSHYHASDRA